MEKQTAAFLGALAQKTGEPEFIELLQGVMEREWTTLFSGLTENVAFLSESAQPLSEELDKCLAKCRSAHSPWDALDVLYELNELSSEALRLCDETSTALQAPFLLEPDKFHIAMPEDREKMQEKLLCYIKAQLFRVLALGGPECLTRLPCPADFSLEGQLRYIHSALAPALGEISGDHNWAVCYKLVSVCNSPVSLSLFAPCSIDPRVVCLPGTCERVPDASGKVIWQGRGLLTNITPNNVLVAMKSTIQSSIPDMSVSWEDGKSPKDSADACYPNEFYAIAPMELFTCINNASMKKLLSSRAGNGLCPLCGKAHPITKHYRGMNFLMER